MLNKYFHPIFIILITLVFISCGTQPETTYILDVDVSPIEAGSISPSIGQFNEGEEITLTPSPNEYWVFEKWSGDVNGTSNPLTFTMDTDKSIIGNFVKVEYPLNIEIVGEGTVEEQVIPQKVDDYEHGTVVELSPNPSVGWEFENWSGDIESNEEVIQITIEKETNVTVNFEELSFYISSNGVTIMCPNTLAGDKGFIDGIEYESVDRALLEQRYNEKSDLNKVCVSLVADLSNLFRDETTFNQDIGNWDVSNVTDMSWMFYRSDFNQPLSHWEVVNVSNMSLMFSNSPFNQPINDWDVSNVTDMSAMFFESKYNQPLDDWDVSKVRDMSQMFYISRFNQDISSWCVDQFSSEPDRFSTASPLIDENKPVWGTCPSN